MIVGAAGLGGLAGWRLLQRTADQQIARLAQDPTVIREQQAFAQRMAGQPDAAGLIGDYYGLKVALTAFGLEDDLPNRAFIGKILTSDLNDSSSLANRLSDKRYRALAEAFGFGSEAGPAPDTVERVSELFVAREFERRVGDTDNNMRVALYAQRELAVIAAADGNENTAWYQILGSAPLTEVVRGALGLPDSLGKAPIDQQVTATRDAAMRQLGIKSVRDLADPAVLNRLLDRFVIRSSVGSAGNTPYNTALALLAGVGQSPGLRLF